MSNHEQQGYRAFQKQQRLETNPYPHGWYKAYAEHKAWVKYLAELGE